jgi:polygalacturonase
MANAAKAFLVGRLSVRHLVFLAITGLGQAGLAFAQTPATGPVRSWNVTDFGAVSDSKTDASPAIEAAIKACSTGGDGTVVVPAGIYFCTPIELLHDVDLHLDAGATLLFSRSMSDYPLALVDNGSGEIAGVRSPIWSEKQKNISISGGGVIDGQGSGWRQTKQEKLSAEAWNQLVKSGGVIDQAGSSWYPDAIARDGSAELNRLQAMIASTPLDAFAKYRSLLRPNLIRLSECQGVVLSGVTFRQSASWNIHLSLCDDVQVHHITVFNPAYAQNGDGIDVDSCRNVTIADSKFDAGDDAICLKSGMDEAGRKRARPTENITITRCTVGTGHGGVVIGSEMSGGVSNVNVSDCVFDGTDSGLRFKSVRGRGGIVENVNVNHIEMSDIHGVAILFDLYYETGKKHSKNPPAIAVDEGTPIFRQFSIHNITCNGAKLALQLRGLPEMPLEGVTLDGVDISADQAGMIVDAKDITLRNVHIRSEGGEGVRLQHVENLQSEHSTGIAQP